MDLNEQFTKFKNFVKVVSMSPEEVSAARQAFLSGEETSPSVVSPPPNLGTPARSPKSKQPPPHILEQQKKLARLHTDGVINDSEFEKANTVLLQSYQYDQTLSTLRDQQIRQIEQTWQLEQQKHIQTFKPDRRGESFTYIPSKISVIIIASIGLIALLFILPGNFNLFGLFVVMVVAFFIIREYLRMINYQKAEQHYYTQIHEAQQIYTDVPDNNL